MDGISIPGTSNSLVDGNDTKQIHDPFQPSVVVQSVVPIFTGLRKNHK